MRSLAKKKRAFVNAFCESGNLTRAMRDAGYIGKPRSLRTQRWRLTHDVQVQAEIDRVTREQFINDAPIARRRLLHLVEHAKSEAVQVRAAEILLDRGLGKAPDQHLHLHAIVDEKDIASKRERLRALLPLLGLSPGLVIDGDAQPLPAPISPGINSHGNEREGTADAA